MSRPGVLGPDQQMLADAVRGYCAAKCTDELARDPASTQFGEFWRGLGGLGVFALAMPVEEGGAAEIVAASGELGRALAPGPVAGTFFAVHALPQDAGSDVAAGVRLASVGRPPLMPWAEVADVYIEWTGAEAWSATIEGERRSVATLGNEPWARCTLRREQPLDHIATAAAYYNLALSGYSVGAGRRTLEIAVEHARTRSQFGRVIGSFQSVAHPLVDAGLELEAAEKLSIVAAQAVDAGHPGAPGMAAAARLSASRAAMNAALTSHQTLGAIGYTIEGPIGHVTQRIRQITMLADGDSWLEQEVLSTFSAER